MSWDVIMIRTQANSEAIDEINSEDIIPFKQTEIASVIKKIAKKPDSSRWSIEFNVGEHPDTESVMLHIRGGEPKEVFAVLMADLNTRLIDCSTGRFISLDKTTGFKRWKAYRDKIVNGR